MTEEIIIAGFGGQGVLSMGKILAYAGIIEGLEVTWMPSYGPEMRGGTANVTVILSNEEISSPILNLFDTAILLNQQSLDKFQNSVKPGGILLHDINGITTPPNRKDIKIISIDATAEAARMASPRIFNMLVLGAYLKLKPVVANDSIIKGLKETLPPRHHHMLIENKDALLRGFELINS